MTVQTGIFSWDLYKETFPIVLAGREINTNLDPLLNSFSFAHPVVTAGVRTAQGFHHQSTTPSPKAPGAASRPFTFTLFPDPQLDEDTHRHYEAVYASAEFQLPKIWFPFPFLITWRITTGRGRYSTPFFISGSTGEASVGQPRFFEPIVEIREKGGIFVEALSFAASSPSSTEFSLDSITDDSRAILVGDLSAHDGKQLLAWIYCLIEVLPQGLTGEFARPGEWRDELPLISSPSTFDYEGDGDT